MADTRNLSSKVFPLRRAKNAAGMAGSTMVSVGASTISSTAEISGVFRTQGRGEREIGGLRRGEMRGKARRGGKGGHGSRESKRSKKIKK